MLKKMIATAAISAALVLPAFASPEVGKEAPAFTARTADGKTIDLKSLRGKIVVLEWTNHECPYVRMHYNANNMQSTQKDATGQGVVWLQIISSPPGKQGFVEGLEAIKVNTDRKAVPTHTVLDPDGKVGRLYAAQTTPHMYVIDAKGTLVYKGGIDSIPSSRPDSLPKAVNYVRETLAALAANKPVPNPSTRPYGCTIHYGS
ncbi:MAG TPA: redoxin domain-containing protein [Xanthobacteraceae bacterium]|nr:redoxin domain-containing protein [Xanthobacteraceae bacterium]